MSALTHLALFLLGLAAGLGSPTAHLDRERTIVVTSRPPYYTPAVLRVTAGEAVRWINPLPAERHGVREVEQSTFSFELSPGGEQVVRFHADRRVRLPLPFPSLDAGADRRRRSVWAVRRC